MSSIDRGRLVWFLDSECEFLIRKLSIGLRAVDRSMDFETDIKALSGKEVSSVSPIVSLVSLCRSALRRSSLVRREDAAQGRTTTETLVVLTEHTRGKQCHTGERGRPHVDRNAVSTIQQGGGTITKAVKQGGQGPLMYFRSGIQDRPVATGELHAQCF